MDRSVKIMPKYLNLIFYTLTFSIIFAGCGIENSMYFQEPRNVIAYIKGTSNPITTSGTDSAAIKFYGYNQEKDNSKYVFAGYDIYYYFPSSTTKRKANVMNPILPSNAKLIPFVTNEPSRFPSTNFQDSNFYQVISLPVTNSMIDNNLTQGSNDNVRFTFGYDDLTGTQYPMIGGISGEAGSYVYLGAIFPTLSEYNGKSWGSLDPNFQGFYDLDYYINNSITPISGNPSTPTDCVYQAYFYLVAKGFNSDIERNQNFIESIPSTVVTVYFLAKASTKTP
jgi:hypothetical protein